MAYTIGFSVTLIALIAIVVAVVGKRKRNKKTENPRAKKIIEKELKEISNSEDGKVEGSLLGWCIFTICYVLLGISGNVGEFSVWLQAFFIIALLIMAIKGRGKWFIIIISALLSAFLFWVCVTTTGASLRSSCIWSDFSKAYQCTAVPDFVWESEAEISRIAGAIGGSYYGITALYFCLSKRAKRHFNWREKQATLWLELWKRNSLEKTGGQTDNESEKEINKDEKTELKELLEENRRLASKIKKLEQKTKEKGK